MNEYDVPDDFQHPNWNENKKVHEWKNYICEELQEIWHSFTIDQKKIIAMNAQLIANNEEYYERT